MPRLSSIGCLQQHDRPASPIMNQFEVCDVFLLRGSHSFPLLSSRRGPAAEWSKEGGRKKKKGKRYVSSLPSRESSSLPPIKSAMVVHAPCVPASRSVGCTVGEKKEKKRKKKFHLHPCCKECEVSKVIGCGGLCALGPGCSTRLVKKRSTAMHRYASTLPLVATFRRAGFCFMEPGLSLGIVIAGVGLCINPFDPLNLATAYRSAYCRHNAPFHIIHDIVSTADSFILFPLEGYSLVPFRFCLQPGRAERERRERRERKRRKETKDSWSRLSNRSSITDFFLSTVLRILLA